MVDRGLRRGFDPAVEHEAREVSASDVGGADAPGSGRRDLRSLPTFTVDPPGARDFDDAISASEEGDGSRRVWVHIADVCAYVRPLSPLDREAYRRGTSVYVPGAVEPMLPGALSNHACSLVPGQDRLAMTVEMVIDGDRVRPPAFYRSVIRSDERLDYDRVDRLFAGRESATGVWGPGLACARAAAAALAARRGAQGALEIDSAEPEFAFDERGNVASIRQVEQTESHRMIEHLMIAANEQVSRFLTSRRVPTLYRVHERPDGVAAERLIDQLASLGVPTPPAPKGQITPQQAADLIGEASQLVESWTARRARTGSARLDQPRAALAQAGLLRPAQPRARRPAAGQLLPLHLADPTLPGFGLPSRAALGGGRRGACARGLLGGRGRSLVLGARARGDGDRARRGRHRALLPARAWLLGILRRPSRGRWWASSAPVRSWRSAPGRVRGHAARPPPAR